MATTTAYLPLSPRITTIFLLLPLLIHGALRRFMVVTLVVGMVFIVARLLSPQLTMLTRSLPFLDLWCICLCTVVSLSSLVSNWFSPQLPFPSLFLSPATDFGFYQWEQTSWCGQIMSTWGHTNFCICHWKWRMIRSRQSVLNLPYLLGALFFKLGGGDTATWVC